MQKLMITNSGKELISGLIAETISVNFTKIALSEYNYASADLQNLKDLAEVRQSIPISDVTRVDSSTVEIIAVTDNTPLVSGYYVRALGVYAKTADGKEVLFAVSIEPDNPDYLPPFGGKTVSSITYRLRIKVDNADQINIDVDPGAYVTVEQLNNIRAEMEKKIKTHDTNQNAHGNMRSELHEETVKLAARVSKLELETGDISSNLSFAYALNNLDGLKVTGIWNSEQGRVEF